MSARREFAVSDLMSSAELCASQAVSDGHVAAEHEAVLADRINTVLWEYLRRSRDEAAAASEQERQR